MARKEAPEPLLAHKHAFIKSLDNVLNESMMLITVVESILQQDTGIKPQVAALLKERVIAFRKTIYTEE